MNPCANCGAAPRPNDKFCNTCGTPVPVAAPAAAAQPYAAAAGWGAAPPPPRCQMGHEVAPGQNYCPQGHPIALEQVQFAASAPQQAPYDYGAQQTPAQAYGASPSGSGAKYAQAGPAAAPPQPGPSYGAAPAYGAAPQYPPQPAAYVPPPAPPPAYGAPPAAPQGYAPPAAAPPYGPPGGGAVGAPPVAAEAKAAPVVLPNSLAGFLVSFEGNAVGDFWPLNGGRYALGRANSGETVDIPLADATISSRHAFLEVDALTGKVVVEDTASTNGTFVNDEHVGFSGRRELRDGDRLRLGGFTTIVKIISRG